MKNEIIEFFNNFNMDDLLTLLQNMDLLSLLSHPAVVSFCIALVLLYFFEKWRPIIIKVLSYSLLYGYLFVTFVIVKNSELSYLPTFLMFLSAIFILAGLGIFKGLMK